MIIGPFFLFWQSIFSSGKSVTKCFSLRIKTNIYCWNRFLKIIIENYLKVIMSLKGATVFIIISFKGTFYFYLVLQNLKLSDIRNGVWQIKPKWLRSFWLLLYISKNNNWFWQPNMDYNFLFNREISNEKTRTISLIIYYI